jgi:hypothetical protein
LKLEKTQKDKTEEKLNGNGLNVVGANSNIAAVLDRFIFGLDSFPYSLNFKAELIHEALTS